MKQADACTKPGELGALLRGEGLYSSHLVDWRRARENGELEALAPKKRGRKPNTVDTRDKRIAELERELAKERARREHAEALVDVQKNLPRSGATAGERDAMIAIVNEVGGRLGFEPTCAALGLSRATYYRHRYGPKSTVAARRKPKQALDDVQRQAVLDVLHEDRFIDLSPTEVYAQLLNEGRYDCSIRTMYRILVANPLCGQPGSGGGNRGCAACC